MESSELKQPQSPMLSRVYLKSLGVSIACQLSLLVLIVGLDPWLPLSLGTLGSILATPLSAACGAVFLKKRHPNLSSASLVLFIVLAMVVVTVIAALAAVATGNYDVP